MKKQYQDKEWLEKKIKTIGNLHRIGELCGVSGDTIEYWRKKFSIEHHIVFNRKTKLNESFFREIDTEEKAYWLGFLMADGCISKIGKKNTSYRLIVVLKSTDIKHLEKFKSALEYNGKIIKKEINDKRGFTTEKAELRINSKALCKDLIKFGVIPQKTGKEIIPSNIPDYLIKDFVRGFFDGDGSITKSNTKNFYRFKLGSASEKILQQIKDWFSKNGIEEVPYYLENQYRIPFFILESNCRSKCDQIYHLLYDDANIYLDRKYERVLDMFRYCALEQRCS